MSIGSPALQPTEDQAPSLGREDALAAEGPVSRPSRESCRCQRAAGMDARQLDFEGGESAGASSRGAPGQARAYPCAGFLRCSSDSSDDARRAGEVEQAARDPRGYLHTSGAHSTRLVAPESAPTRRASRRERAIGGAVQLLLGRFEAQFPDREAARAAARDARSVGFVVDVETYSEGWLAVGRRHLPFPSDERDRYASRFHAIAARHGGAFSQFVEETPAGSARSRATTSEEGRQ